MEIYTIFMRTELTGWQMSFSMEITPHQAPQIKNLFCSLYSLRDITRCVNPLSFHITFENPFGKMIIHWHNTSYRFILLNSSISTMLPLLLWEKLVSGFWPILIQVNRTLSDVNIHFRSSNTYYTPNIANNITTMKLLVIFSESVEVVGSVSRIVECNNSRRRHHTPVITRSSYVINTWKP